MKHLGMQCALDPFITLRSETDPPLPPARNKLDDMARRCLLANALIACWQGGDGVHYSRNKNFYTQPTCWSPKWFSHRKIIRAVDDLTSAGLVESKLTRPSPNAIYRSSFWATPKLLAQFRNATLSDLQVVARPVVELRDRETNHAIDVRRLPHQQQRELSAIVDDVAAQNALIAGSISELRRGTFARSPQGLVRAMPAMIAPMKCQLRRIFLDDLRFGGRWYGPWWQNIPSAARKGLMIDGEPTVEVDFSACQIRLAYGVCGLRDPMNGQVDKRDAKIELYEIARVKERLHAKEAALIMLNARNKISATRALAQWLGEERALHEEASLYKEAARIIDEVANHFVGLAPVWFSDLGLQLQRIDGDICARVQAVFRKRGIVVLSVHDSFVIAQQHEEDLRRGMAEAFGEGMNEAASLRRLQPATA